MAYCVYVHLKTLTLRGFKSFATATTLTFEPGINCVVGPNGSGKSNVVDALAWVMGEQGAKNLRGGNMADVIFAGTSKRPALGRAEVSLTIDNSDGALPIDYTEVTISRTLFRSGGSEYAINGTSCRLLDIQELLSDTGMGREMHVIIGQGKLDEVLKASAEDRRGFIEEAAGVLKHRRRKEKALRKLESMSGSFARIEDLSAELRRQLGPLARQAEAARKAQVMQAEVRDSKARLLADDLAQQEARVQAHHVDESKLTERRMAAGRRVGEIREQLSQLEDEASVANPELASLIGRWERAASLEERFRSLGQLALERQRSLTAVTKPFHGEKPEDIVSKAKRARTEEEELRQRVESAQDALTSAIAEREKAEGVERRAEREHVDLARAAADRREEEVRLAGRISAVAGRVEALEAERERLSASLEAAKGRAEEATAKVAQLEQDIVANADREDPLAAEHEASSAEVNAARTALEEARSRLLDERARLASWQAKAETLKQSLAPEDATAWAWQNCAGIAGLVRDGIAVDAGWESAVESALAGVASGVVVDGRDAAIDVLRSVREADAGRLDIVYACLAAGATEDIRTGRETEDVQTGGETEDARTSRETKEDASARTGRLRELKMARLCDVYEGTARDGEGGGAARGCEASGERPDREASDLAAGGAGHGQEARDSAITDARKRVSVTIANLGLGADRAVPAADVVRANISIAGAIAAVLAEYALAADLATASILLEAGVPVVATLAGDVIDRRCAQGGEVSRASVLARQRAFDEAVREAEQARGAGQAAEDEVRACAERLERARSEHERTGSELAARDSRIAAVTAQLGVLRQSLSSARGEVESNTSRLAALDAELRDKREERESLLARRDAAVAAPDDLAERAERAAQARQAAHEHTRECRQGETDARLALRTSEERLRAVAGRADALMKSAQALAERIEREERQARRREEAARLASRVGQRASRALAIAERVKNSVERRRKIAEEAREARNSALSAARKELDEASNALRELEDASHRQELLRAEIQMKYEQLAAKSLDELGVEATVLVEEFGPHRPVPLGDGTQVPYVREEQKKRLSKAQAGMSRLGKINPLALEEHAALEERQKYLAGQLADLKRSREDLLGIVRTVDKRVEEVMTSAIEDVSACFKEVFARLFPGGEGRLVVTDEDVLTTGVEIEARPPGKRVKRLSLLSGGERSLTAVAFLVAIFMARPSPFYVMDEVEAALDDVNLSRLIEIFSELQSSSQLLVVTHQKRTMETADTLYGVAMREDGVSTVVSQRLRDVSPT